MGADRTTPALPQRSPSTDPNSLPEAQAQQVAGGDCVSPGVDDGMVGTYDGLVDVTSQVIESVITATKTF